MSLNNFQLFWPSHSNDWELFYFKSLSVLPFPTKSEAFFSFAFKKSRKSLLARKIFKIKFWWHINILSTSTPLLCTFVYVLFRKLILSIFRAKHKIIFSLRNIDEETLKQLEMVTEGTKGTYKLQKVLRRTKNLWCEKLFYFRPPNFFRAKKKQQLFSTLHLREKFQIFYFFFKCKLMSQTVLSDAFQKFQATATSLKT